MLGKGIAVTALETEFSFDTFVPGEENVLAIEAANKLLAKPGDQYNPFLLHGPPGVGKSHFLSALRSRFERQHPRWNVLSLPAGEFIEECDSARQSKSTYEFRQQLWTLDLLLVDDIHLLDKREAALEELYHAFNRFVADGRQLVFTSREAPVDLVGFPTPLRMRLQSGLVVPIEPPRERMMRDLIEQQAYACGLRPTQKAAGYLCREVRSVRELNGIFRELRNGHNGSAHHPEPSPACIRTISLDEVRAILKKQATEQLTISDVAKAVCDYLRVDLQRVRSPSRRQSLVQARQLAMHLVRELTSAPLTAIGRYFGGRDHTTVLYACRKMAEDVQKCSYMNRAARDLKTILRG